MNTSGSKQKNFPITNIGSVTLLMIFIVLCMITFAALSLSSAASDYQTARKSATHAQEYYKASGRAEKTLAKIDQVLKNCYLQTSDIAGYYKNIEQHYKNNSDITLKRASDSLTLTYQTKINDKQALQTHLLILHPSEQTDKRNLSSAKTTTPDLYRITGWQTVSTADWNGDNSLNLLRK